MPFYSLNILFEYIGRMDCMEDLPVDVLSNIVSYTHSEPEYVKIKHSEAFRRIQNKYKISRLGPKITRQLKSRKLHYEKIPKT